MQHNICIRYNIIEIDENLESKTYLSHVVEFFTTCKNMTFYYLEIFMDNLFDDNYLLCNYSKLFCITLHLKVVNNNRFLIKSKLFLTVFLIILKCFVAVKFYFC